MIIGTAIQQPDERLDYDIKYTTWLGTTGDTLVSDPQPLCVSVPSGLTMLAVVAGENLDRVKVWVSGGVIDVKYVLEVTSTTQGGRIKQDELVILIKEF